MQTSEQYTALQRYELTRISGPVIILGIPGNETVCLGFSPTENDADYRPVIFPSKAAAELCKSTILSEEPDHAVQKMQPWVIKHSAIHKEGYTIKPIIGTCPFCGTTVMTGIAEKELFHCDACGKDFPMCP